MMFVVCGRYYHVFFPGIST
jgi:hypothetical protein